jgi:hypothetical protein
LCGRHNNPFWVTEKIRHVKKRLAGLTMRAPAGDTFTSQAHLDNEEEIGRQSSRACQRRD